MPVDRRLVVNVDWFLVGACLILSAIGVATILSATHTGRGLGLEIKQVYWILLGILSLVISVTIDYRRLTDRALILYVIIVAALLYVLHCNSDVEIHGMSPLIEPPYVCRSGR